MQHSSRRRVIMPKFETSFQINSIKDLINARLEFKFPQGYSQFQIEKKIHFWKQRLAQLSKQETKIVYWLPDTLDQKDVQIVVQLIKKQYSQNKLLNCQFQKTFVTNAKKQLLIFRNCNTMVGFLQKYRLPKNYQDQMKSTQKDAQKLSQLIIQRNQFISLGEYEKVEQMQKKVQELSQKFNSSFSKLEVLMQKIFLHFKQQKNRKQILLIAVRQSVIERLRILAKSHHLFLRYRFSQTDGDQFKDIIIKKENDYYPQDEQIKSQSTQKSSVVQSSFESEEQLVLLPPKGVDSVEIIKILQKTIIFKVKLMSQTKKSQPDALVVTQKEGKIIKLIPLKEIKMQNLEIQLQFYKKDFLQYTFYTKNSAGSSYQKQIFKINLNLNQNLTFTQKSVYLIQNFKKNNQNKILPQQKIDQTHQKFIKKIVFSATDLSLSSKHAMICDSKGSVATWGAIYTNFKSSQQNIQSQQQVIEEEPINYTFSLENPFKLMSQQSKIVKVSCGLGYGLLLDMFGNVWSYGLNHVGQLGLGSNYQEGIQQPQMILTFRQFKQASFILDIYASQNGSSFAIDSQGQLYRWGLNQVDQSLNPVIDRFDRIINYSTDRIVFKQYTPIPVKKAYSDQKIIKIVTGNQFTLALNSNGDLYGWGRCNCLGIGKLCNKSQQQVQNICNPLEIMKNIQNVSAGYEHSIVVLKNGTVKGWGIIKYLSNILNGERQQKPIDLTSQYGQICESDIIACGKTYTVVYKKSQINIFGKNIPFQKQKYSWNQKIHKIVCSQDYIGFLSQKEKILQENKI